jgi:predicted ATPase
MLKKIYIDNYKTFVNFHLELDSFQLFLGENGSGKTSVFDVLSLLKDVMAGVDVNKMCGGNTLTCWNNITDQKFELEMKIGNDLYQYTLLVGKRREDDCIIKHEELLWNKKQFFYFDGQEVHLFRINRYTNEPEEGTHFPGDWHRSFLAQVGDREDNVPIQYFRKELSNYMVVHPNPVLLSEHAVSGLRNLVPTGENFAAWFWHLSLELPQVGQNMSIFLKEVLTSYRYLSLKESGRGRRLCVGFDDYILDFSQLSDGQRQLILLYTLLAYIQENPSTLFVDEPDNFVTLREIGPWWNEINEMCESPEKQVILISHHPTIVNRMGHDKALWFSRPEGKHTVVKPYDAVADVGGLTPAEIMERGWQNE